MSNRAERRRANRDYRRKVRRALRNHSGPTILEVYDGMYTLLTGVHGVGEMLATAMRSIGRDDPENVCAACDGQWGGDQNLKWAQDVLNTAKTTK